MQEDPGFSDSQGGRSRNPIVLTLAVLNLVLGGFGAVCCGGLAAMQALVPTLVRPAMEEMQAEMQADRERREQAFEQRIEEAATDEERAEVEAQRTRWRESHPDVDIAQMFSVQDDPRLRLYFMTDAISGILANLLLIASGVGLLLTERWGRTLGLATAVLKLALVIGGSVYMALVVTPLTAEYSEQVLEESEKLAREGMIPPGFAGMTADLQRTAGHLGILVQAVFGSFYPLVLLVSLNLGSVKRSFPPRVTST